MVYIGIGIGALIADEISPLCCKQFVSAARCSQHKCGIGSNLCLFMLPVAVLSCNPKLARFRCIFHLFSFNFALFISLSHAKRFLLLFLAAIFLMRAEFVVSSAKFDRIRSIYSLETNEIFTIRVQLRELAVGSLFILFFVVSAF